MAAVQFVEFSHSLFDMPSYFQIVIFNSTLSFLVQKAQTFDSHVFAEFSFDVFSILLSHLDPVILHIMNFLDIAQIHQILNLLLIDRRLASLSLTVPFNRLLLETLLWFHFFLVLRMLHLGEFTTLAWKD